MQAEFAVHLLISFNATPCACWLATAYISPLVPGYTRSLVLQVDFLMSGLMVLKERIDATEALIAIDLDNRRNELVAFDLVMLSS